MYYLHLQASELLQMLRAQYLLQLLEASVESEDRNSLKRSSFYAEVFSVVAVQDMNELSAMLEAVEGALFPWLAHLEWFRRHSAQSYRFNHLMTHGKQPPNELPFRPDSHSV